MQIKWLCILLAITQILSAQNPNWQWAKSGKGELHDYGIGVTADINGNSYATGYFQVPSIVFGNDTLTGSINYHDNFYIVKYDNLGNEQWATSGGDENNAYTDCINLDRNGNIFVSGSFQGSGTMTLGTDTLGGNTGYEQAFIAKYDNAGNPLWARTLGSDVSLQTNVTHSLDDIGNVYAAFTLNQTSFLGVEMHLVKYDNLGNLIWQTNIPSNNFSDQITAIAADVNGNTYLTGTMLSTSLVFGNDTIINTSNGQIIFVVKYDNTGNVVWAKSTGEYASLYEPSIGVDLAGNSYITGYFIGQYAKFGNVILTNASDKEDIFIAKFDNLGNAVWAKQAGGSNFDEGKNMRTDENGNTYICGLFQGTAHFDNIVIFSAGQSDAFAAKYNASGTALWAQKAGGSNVDYANGVGIDPNGNCYVTGSFTSSPIHFGTNSVVNSDTIFYSYEVFVAKLGSVSNSIEPDEYTLPTIQVCPNPFSSVAYLSINRNLENADLSIYDLQGQKVREINNISGQGVTINRDGLSNGLYFIRLKENNQIFTGKLMISF